MKLFETIHTYGKRFISKEMHLGESMALSQDVIQTVSFVPALRKHIKTDLPSYNNIQAQYKQGVWDINSLF